MIFFCRFLTDNGIHTQESSVQNGRERVVRGSYSYIGPDGKTYKVHYIADRHGYRAYGAHLPTQPDAVANIIQQAQQGVLSTTGAYVPLYSSTIAPIYNRPTQRPTFVSSTPAAPFYSSTTATPPFQQPNYNVPAFASSTPIPPISSNPYDYNNDGYNVAPTLPPPISQFTTAQSLIDSNRYNNFATSTQSPFAIQHTTTSPAFGSSGTVYITPAPKTYISNNGYVSSTTASPNNFGLSQFDGSSYHYDHFDRHQQPLLQSQHFNTIGGYQQQQQQQPLQFELPTVQPLYNNFRNSFSGIRPSAFDRVPGRY